jgi:hypothetical protein
MKPKKPRKVVYEWWTTLSSFVSQAHAYNHGSPLTLCNRHVMRRQGPYTPAQIEGKEYAPKPWHPFSVCRTCLTRANERGAL